VATTAPTPPAPPAKPVFAPPPKPPEGSNVEALGQLMTVLSLDPKTRPRVLELIREADPSLAIPELDFPKQTAATVDAATKPLREENAQLVQRLSKLENKMERQGWQDEWGVDDEEFDAVVKFAGEKKIGDPTAALDYYRKSGLGRPRGTFASDELTDEDRKALYKNPKAWYETRAHKVLADLRRGRRGA